MLDFDSEQLLAEELDSIDSPLAGEHVNRPSSLILPSTPTLQVF